MSINAHMHYWVYSVYSLRTLYTASIGTFYNLNGTCTNIDALLGWLAHMACTLRPSPLLRLPFTWLATLRWKCIQLPHSLETSTRQSTQVTQAFFSTFAYWHQIVQRTSRRLSRKGKYMQLWVPSCLDWMLLSLCSCKFMIMGNMHQLGSWLTSQQENLFRKNTKTLEDFGSGEHVWMIFLSAVMIWQQMQDNMPFAEKIQTLLENAILSTDWMNGFGWIDLRWYTKSGLELKQLPA